MYKIKEYLTIDTIVSILSLIIGTIIHMPYIVIIILCIIIIYLKYEININDKNINKEIKKAISNISKNQNNSDCYNIYNTLKKTLKNKYLYEIEDIDQGFTSNFNRDKYLNFLKGHIK